MKRINGYIALLLLSVLVLNCRPEELKTYEPVQTGGLSSLTGVWKGESVVQHDADAERKGFPYQVLDVTEPTGFTGITLTLTATAGAEGTFDINYGDAAPLFRHTAGGWKVDNAEKVGQLLLFNGTDTLRFTMGSYEKLANNKMALRQSKKLLGREAIYYDYTFTR
ncbi:MAG TPA: hypothetical protein VHK69_12555 [Chitinophagaceae bacterium]|jgi:hypothetical protein|nr:hypothetical protein [Chitinophagaceae bacterium]